MFLKNVIFSQKLKLLNLSTVFFEEMHIWFFTCHCLHFSISISTTKGREIQFTRKGTRTICELIENVVQQFIELRGKYFGPPCPTKGLIKAFRLLPIEIFIIRFDCTYLETPKNIVITP